MTQNVSCRCVSYDPHDCARIRYRRYVDGIGDGLNDPCDCACHDDFEWDEDDDYAPFDAPPETPQ